MVRPGDKLEVVDQALLVPLERGERRGGERRRRGEKRNMQVRRVKMDVREWVETVLFHFVPCSLTTHP